MKYRCNDCTYYGKRVVLVDNKHVICPACGGDIKVSYKLIAEELERREVESTSLRIENDKNDVETIVDEWNV
jgi:Zn finger protein HypA/HybF involved in hydrogenase expression